MNGSIYLYSGTAGGYLTRDLTVLSCEFAIKIKPDFRGKQRPQNQPNLLQIRCISEQLIKEHYKKQVYNS